MLVKKNQERTVRQTDYRAGNVKKFGFLKVNFKNGVEKLWVILPKTPFFHSKLFFHWLWESFLCVVWLRSNYLRDCLNIVLHVGKKIRNVRHVKQIIGQETWKSLDFWRSTSKMGLDLSFKKLPFSTQNFFFANS